MKQNKSNCAVLLPVYKNDKVEWVSDAIDSIIDQKGLKSIPNIYLGIDGPIDDNLKILINSKKHNFKKIIENKLNLGLPTILNRLIEELDDEVYVFRADADDICEPNRFKLQIDYLEKHPEIEILGGALTEIDADNNIIGYRFWATDPAQIASNLYKATAMAHPTVCFRRNALTKLGKYREDLHISEDLELWFRAAKLGIVMANLPNQLVRFRITPNTYKRRGKSKAWAEFIIYTKGSLELYGFTWRLFFPFARLLARILPLYFIKYLYKSNLRNIILK